MRALVAFCLAAALLLQRGVVHAQPSPIREHPYAQSADWITVATPFAENDELRLEVTTAVSCAVPDRDAAELTLCNGGGAADTIIHVFSALGEEIGAPVQCGDGVSPCVRSVSTAESPAGLHLLVHGGPASVGIASVQINAFRNGAAFATWNATYAGNILVDLGAALARYRSPVDVVSVLVPDGPPLPAQPLGARNRGNEANDWLGVAATEAWLLDERFRVLNADLRFSGVGRAARLGGLAVGVDPQRTARWALVRPWRPMPGILRLNGRLFAYPAIAPESSLPGRMRVLVNEPTQDTDQDGVSDRIESLSGTCNGASPTATANSTYYRCPSVAMMQNFPSVAMFDPRDSDGDGISDGAEILGTDRAFGRPLNGDGTCNPNATQIEIFDANQTFPLWGFSPIHADMLVEVDRVVDPSNAASCSDPAFPADPNRFTGECSSVNPTGCRADLSVVPVRACQPGADWWKTLRDAASIYERADSIASANGTTGTRLLPGTRILNRDGGYGIRVHFDARGPAAATQGHGTRSAFIVVDESQHVRNDLFIYQPEGEVRSSCACALAYACPDPRHGGYARYYKGGDGGGGSSPVCGSELGGGLASSTVIAHELGHSVGLQHGGPTLQCSGENNPFAAPASEALDVAENTKLIHVSGMNYAYLGTPFTPETFFSLGQNNGVRLPRVVTVPEGQRYGYPERDLANWTELMGSFGDRGFTALQNAGLWTDLDLDRDGYADSVLTRGIETGTLRNGSSLRFSVSGFMCPNSQSPSNGDAWGCCRSGIEHNGECWTEAGGNGQRLGPTREWPVDRSMVQTVQIGMTVLGNDLIGFVGDDAIGRAPGSSSTRDGPRRCARNQTPTECCPEGVSGAACNAPFGGARLRWLRAGRFTSPPNLSMMENPCFSESGVGCFDTGTSPAFGDVQVDGVPWSRPAPGVTSLATATVRDTTGNPLTFLAWSDRDGLRCTDESATEDEARHWFLHCDDQWGTLNLALTSVQNAGGAMNFLRVPVSSLLNAAGIPRVSHVAAAAWNRETGADDRLTLIVRAPLVAGGGGELYWTECGSFTQSPSGWTTLAHGVACRAFTRMQGVGRVYADALPQASTTTQDLSSWSGVAAAAEPVRSGGPPRRLLLAFGRRTTLPNSTDDDMGDQVRAKNLVIGRIAPQESAFRIARGPWSAAPMPREQDLAAQRMHADSALSMAVDEQGAIFVSREVYGADQSGRANVDRVVGADGVATSVRDNLLLDFSTQIIMTRVGAVDFVDDTVVFFAGDTNTWRRSRTYFTTRPEVGGDRFPPVVAHGPGVPLSVIFDPRMQITDLGTQPLERQVRMLGIDIYGGILVAFNNLITDTPFRSRRSYEEVATIGWGLCRVTGASCSAVGGVACSDPSTNGRWSPDLYAIDSRLGSAGRQILCPRGSAFGRSNPTPLALLGIALPPEPPLYVIPLPRPPDPWPITPGAYVADRILYEGMILSRDPVRPHVREIQDAFPSRSCNLPNPAGAQP